MTEEQVAKLLVDCLDQGIVTTDELTYALYEAKTETPEAVRAGKKLGLYIPTVKQVKNAVQGIKVEPLPREWTEQDIIEEALSDEDPSDQLSSDSGCTD